MQKKADYMRFHCWIIFTRFFAIFFSSSDSWACLVYAKHIVRYGIIERDQKYEEENVLRLAKKLNEL